MVSFAGERFSVGGREGKHKIRPRQAKITEYKIASECNKPRETWLEYNLGGGQKIAGIIQAARKHSAEFILQQLKTLNIHRHV